MSNMVTRAAQVQAQLPVVVAALRDAAPQLSMSCVTRIQVEAPPDCCRKVQQPLPSL